MKGNDKYNIVPFDSNYALEKGMRGLKKKRGEEKGRLTNKTSSCLARHLADQRSKKTRRDPMT